ncbi:restriction endonuclease subunit S [Streptococcus pluranimalium]|uniref:Restriction endonuclease subunit S n=1 Tax=Streptococcus pluranimalium TaxID=82348 RepID=A0A2L0D3R9_9STRE|nr:restriction endonuclease subunit S [Streptococcus pluranimalium]AUW96483.1 restriction endonuclease subunit S [Streptococcus pluranimalium]
MTNKNIPKLRFKNFDDEWEKVLLNEIVRIVGGGTPSTSVDEYWNGDINWFSPTEVGGSVYASESDKKITQLGLEKSSAKILPADKTILFTSRAGIGDAAILKTDSTTNQGFQSLVLDDKTDIYFLYSQKENLKRYATKNAAGSTFLEISGKELGKMPIILPSLPEQSAIGTLFQTLDELLSAYKDNLANYQVFKATMLSKMFPKGAQTTPEIRLDGFDGEWEEKTLGDVTERVQGNDGRIDLPTLTISAANGWMNQEDRFSQNIAGKEQKNYTLLKKGELSYNHGNSKLAKYGVVFELETYEEALVPRVYHSFKTIDKLSDPKFIEIMFATKKPDRELGKLISSGARMDGLLNINYSEFMGIKIVIPSFEEQRAIGAFFANLDDLIASQQAKITELETLKKKLLQDMFI